MEGKEAIVGRIIADAEKEASARIAEAERRAAAQREEALREAEALLAEGKRAALREAEECVRRRETVAGLDERKLLLAARRGAVEKVLSEALALARGMKPKAYLAFLEKLISAYAEEGDAAELAADAPVTDKEFTSCKALAEKKLRFAGRNAALEGGLRLENNVCVKDLSFRALIEAERSTLEQEIAGALFPAEA